MRTIFAMFLNWWAERSARRAEASRQRQLAKRKFFRFHDGEKWHYVDPLRAFRELQNHPKLNVAEHLAFAQSAHEPEATLFFACFAEVMGAKRWNGREGLTDGELLRVFYDFDDYLEGVKKKLPTPPTSSSPGDSRHGGDSPIDPPTITSSPSGSSLTAEALPIAPPVAPKHDDSELSPTESATVS